jgi:hypothetical protein
VETTVNTTTALRQMVEVIEKHATPKTDRELVLLLARLCQRLSERVDHLEKK